MWLILERAIQLGVMLSMAGLHPGHTGGKETPPDRKPSKWIDLAISGNHAQAMEQAKRLMVALKANNWSPMGIPKSLCRLPDQDFYPDQSRRTKESISFSLGGLKGFDRAPYVGEIAFYSSLYVSNVRIKPDGTVGMKHEPHGFYIVGYRNGRVEKVDVKDVRYVPSTYARNAFQHTFPNTKAYAGAFRSVEEAFRSTRTGK